MTKIQKITYYVLQTLLSFGFLAAGFPKIMGDPMAAAGFAQAHLPLWFMCFIGIAEIAGAIGLWIRRYSLSTYAAYGLWIILAGATITTLIFTTTPGFAVVPIVYAIILGIIFWLGKKRGV
jgi:uncharacterized membrane protein YphA (DoxX/SURF4 family)